MSVNVEKFSLEPTQFKAKVEELPDEFHFLNENEIPVFKISNIPNDAKSLAIILIDKDAPGDEMIYWILYNLPINIDQIDPVTVLLGDLGNNSVFERKYYGPNPVEGKHRYIFTLFALKVEKLTPSLDIKASDLVNLIKSNMIEKDEVETYVEIKGSYAFA